MIDKFGKPIRGAKVGVEGSDDQVTTDRGGRYRLKAPMDSTLVIEKDGLEVGLALVTGPDLDDAVLVDLDTVGETIEIQGQAPVEAPGSAVIDRKELQRVPGTGGDVVKALTAMPGVVNQQFPLGYSGVVIRGSSPQDSKVLVDDFEIPVLFHNIGFRAILPGRSHRHARVHPGRIRRRLRPRVVGNHPAHDPPWRRQSHRAGRDLGDRRWPARPGQRRQEHAVHVRVPALD